VLHSGNALSEALMKAYFDAVCGAPHGAHMLHTSEQVTIT
jgi:hypothetical protein